MARNVNPRSRAKLLQNTRGVGDVVLDLRGSKHLPPKERAIVDSRPKMMGATTANTVGDNIDILPPWWWNPSNPAATALPAGLSLARYDRLLKGLRAIDRKIGLTFHGGRNIWQLWYHKPGFSTYGNGWVMVKEFKPHQGTSYILKVVQHMDSTVVGTASQRRQKAMEAQIEHKRKVKEEMYDTNMQKAGEVYDFMQIKNIGSGNKSVNFG